MQLVPPPLGLEASTGADLLEERQEEAGAKV
jgi:hypothetical protein